MTRRSKSVVMAVLTLILLEAATLYAYSFLFLLEGQPARHGDPTLKIWAWILLIAMILQAVCFVCWVAWIRKSRPIE
jgi:hypothetical protein